MERGLPLEMNGESGGLATSVGTPPFIDIGSVRNFKKEINFAAAAIRLNLASWLAPKTKPWLAQRVINSEPCGLASLSGPMEDVRRGEDESLRIARASGNYKELRGPTGRAVQRTNAKGLVYYACPSYLKNPAYLSACLSTGLKRDFETKRTPLSVQLHSPHLILASERTPSIHCLP